MDTATLWETIQRRYDDISQQLSDAGIDPEKRPKLQKEFSLLGDLLEKHKEVVALERKQHEAQSEAAAISDPEMKELFEQEVVDLANQVAFLQRELDELMYPADEHDNRSVYLEIRAGAGGKEAALFVADLLKMYTNYAQQRNWRVSVDSSSDTDLGGFKEVVLHIDGKDVYGHLKRESGVHRVQRVPETEASGRVHTSTVTVAVLPEAKEVDVQINPADLRIDVFRASGAGGQHVNTTDSAVRITHIPTGVVVSCQDERSQIKNKAKAMKVLKSRILAAQVEKQQAEMSKERKQQVGMGMRAEKVRTYNYPQNRVTDHQVNLTLKKLDQVMAGELNEIIQALRDEERQSRKSILDTIIS